MQESDWLESGSHFVETLLGVGPHLDSLRQRWSDREHVERKRAKTPFVLEKQMGSRTEESTLQNANFK